MSASVDEKAIQYGKKRLSLDQEIVAGRIISLVQNTNQNRKLLEGTLNDNLIDTGHSLVLMSTYKDPFVLYKGELDKYIMHDVLQGQRTVDIFNKDDNYVRETLERLRSREGLISLVINPEKQLEGRYLIMYSGLDLPGGDWETIFKYHNVKNQEELLNKLNVQDIASRTKAMLSFSIKHANNGRGLLWFLKINGKENYIISDGYTIHLNDI